MATGSDLNDRISKFYHAFMRDGTVAALAREAIKDGRSTIMEIFFGKGERGSEPGTPLTPLFYDLVEARKSHGSVHGGGLQSPLMDGPLSPQTGGGSQMNNDLPTPSQVIDNPAAYLPEQQGPQHGNAMGQENGSVYGDSGPLPTPSQVIDNPSAYLPEQQPGQEHQQQHDHSRSM